MPKEEPFPLPHELYPENWFRRLERDEIFSGEGPIELDLGCGDGSFLARMGNELSDVHFLGVERLLGRVRKVNRKAARDHLENVRILRGDSNYAVNWLLPKNCFRRIHFLCPDPWPKKKHARRRQMCQLHFLRALHSLLEGDGELLFKTDAPKYHEEAVEKQNECDFFSEEPWEDSSFFYPKTDFEEQWLAEGRTIHRLRLRKV